MATHIFTTNSGKILYNGIVVLGIMKFTYSSSTNSISIVNAHDTKDVLVRQAKVEDIEVNGSRYTSFEDLSSVLTELLFIDGRDDESKSGSIKTKNYFYELSTYKYTKLLSSKEDVYLYALLRSDNEISFAYIQNGEGLQENKTNVDFQLYYTIDIANKDLYSFQKIKQDNGASFNLILGTKDITISAPSTSYRRYGFYIENSLKNDTSTNNKYYTISMLITPNASDTQDTKFFSSIVIEKAWKIRINFNAFTKVVNEDGTILLYSTFLLKRDKGEVFTEFGIICEGSTTNTTKVSNIKVEEGQTYTPYVKAFSELSADTNGLNFPIKGFPGSLPLKINGKYVHIAYSDGLDGSGFSTKYENKNYIGLYADNNEAPSSQTSKYKWTMISNINNDIPCYVEEQTNYLHIAYADNFFGSNITSTSGKPYVGYSLDKNSSSKEFNVYGKSLKTQQQLELSILSLDGSITFFEGVEESLDNTLAFKLLNSLYLLDEYVGDTDPLTIYNNALNGN